MPVSLRSAAALLMALVAVTSCKKKPETTPAPVPVAPPVRTPGPNQDSIAAERAKEAARAAAAAAEEARRNAAALAETRNTLMQVIYFDYDKDEIRDDQRVALDAKVPILTANPNVRIRIAGHTDSRGSDEYNLALGQRRSASAKRYLVSRGIADGRIDVVSFGKERPLAPGENEEAWAKNRRDEFEIVAGGENLRVPK
ncbi:MAG TPA: peptidoglycan-associated lipoprotein Pal [Gemmatimonadaceae bacterium]|nr:peptidoglycan-associated lipoprotein Pal [Gemmatimonadaceae bacterium]